jgi:hypothetical protein
MEKLFWNFVLLYLTPLDVYELGTFWFGTCARTLCYQTLKL